MNYTIVDRCLKETDEVIEQQVFNVLQHPLTYLQTHQESFIYVESATFDEVNVDCMTIELDDVFQTYTALFGLRVSKDEEAFLKYFIETETNPTLAKHAILYAQADKMFDMNLTLEALDGFEANWTIEQAIEAVVQLMRKYEAAREEAR